MKTTISIDDYRRAGQREIVPADISDRIETLRKAPLGLPDEAYDLDENEEAELSALVAFRDRVEQVTGNHFDEATIVPADEFEAHARDWAHGIGDFEFLDRYVNWAEFAEDLAAERHAEVDFGAEIVYVR
jgi:hypothetical protein